jgi:hypothetical protein
MEEETSRPGADALSEQMATLKRLRVSTGG